VYAAKEVNSIVYFNSGYIDNFYSTYSTIIDLFIYTLLFIGISQATLGKHFPSRGGKAVVVALGLALAIGLVMSEKTIGFNLRSFGPIAAGILIILVGIMIFLGLKRAGSTSIVATAVAFLITYFIILTVIPGFAQWITSNSYTSWIHLLVIIAFAIIIYKILKSLFSKKQNSLEDILKKNMDDISPENTDLQEQIKQLKGEKVFIKNEMENKSDQAAKASKDMIAELSNMKKMMGELVTPQSRYTVLKTLQSIPIQEQQISNAFLPLKQKVKQLASFDYRHFQQLKNDYPKLPSSDRKLIKQEINEEWKKLNAENKIVKLENAGENYNRNFIRVIQDLSVALKENRIRDALILINEAIKWEEKILRIFKQMKHLEHRLKSYTNHERRFENKELKMHKQFNK
jgi:cell division protein FtsB